MDLPVYLEKLKKCVDGKLPIKQYVNDNYPVLLKCEMHEFVDLLAQHEKFVEMKPADFPGVKPKTNPTTIKLIYASGIANIWCHNFIGPYYTSSCGSPIKPKKILDESKKQIDDYDSCVAFHVSCTEVAKSVGTLYGIGMAMIDIVDLIIENEIPCCLPWTGGFTVETLPEIVYYDPKNYGGLKESF
jgi:hypothetical protein